MCMVWTTQRDLLAHAVLTFSCVACERRVVSEAIAGICDALHQYSASSVIIARREGQQGKLLGKALDEVDPGRPADEGGELRVLAWAGQDRDLR